MHIIRPIIQSAGVRELMPLLVCLLIASYALSYTHNGQRIIAVFLFAGIVWLMYRRSNLKLAELGLLKKNLGGGLRWGLSCAAIVGVFMFTAVGLQPDLFMDERYRQSLQQAVVESIFFIPLATVLFEEIIFRGLLLALLNRHCTIKQAVLVSSLCFGLWHVFSSGAVSSTIFDDASTWTTVTGSVLVMLATGCAGVLFCILRLRSKSLLAPIIAHWSINAFALIAAAIAWNS